MALLSAITTGGIKEFRIDTGEASERVEYRPPMELEKLIDTLERRRTHCLQQLGGTGLVYLNQRRKSGSGNGSVM
ncbi:MAG: hypothetical protein JRE40_09085 [Deltaproteobacteria bacterium]|nr:hypothetical protein [Deltaproteobacteria bacterium]